MQQLELFSTPVTGLTPPLLHVEPDDNSSGLSVSGSTKSEFDPLGISQHSPGAKVDGGKLQAWLFLSGFSKALEQVAKVTTVGAAKYTRNGWKSVPNGSERYMEAFARHLFALGAGKVIDDGPGGTGCYHKAQMIWNLLASLELDLGTGEQIH